MTDDKLEKLPAAWWTWLRLAAVIVTLWMLSGFFSLQHSFDTAGKLSATRTEQAAQLAGVPLSSGEQAYLGHAVNLPPPGDGDRSDQIVAIG